MFIFLLFFNYYKKLSKTMGSIIGFGEWLYPYYYIIISITTKIIKDDVLGFGSNPIMNQRLISKHYIMVLCLSYFSEMFLGLIVYLFVYLREKRRISRKRKKLAMQRKESLEENDNIPELKTQTAINQESINNNDETKNNEINDNNQSLDKTHTLQLATTFKGKTIKKIELIHNDLYLRVTKNSLRYIVLSSLLIVTKEILNKMIFSINDIFDYFFFDLLIMTIISKFQFKERIYSHQLVALILVLFISGGCLISCLFESTNISESNNDEQNNIITIRILEMFKDNYHMIFIMVLIYLALSICFCYGITLQKVLMENKFVTPYRIAIFKGFIGFIITAGVLAISTYFKCNEKLLTVINDSNINNNNNSTNNTTINNNITRLNEDEEDGSKSDTKYFEFIVCSINYNNITYYDHFFEYFESLNKYSDKYLEIVFAFLYFNLHFLSVYTLIIVNKFLSPIHCLIVESLFTTIHLPLQYIYDTFDITEIEKAFSSPETLYNSFFKTKTTRILKIVAYCVGMIGYCIYLEIIELRFCGLNNNLRRNIRKRAIIDAKMKIRDDSSNGSESDSEESNETLERELQSIRNDSIVSEDQSETEK